MKVQMRSGQIRECSNALSRRLKVLGLLLLLCLMAKLKSEMLESFILIFDFKLDLNVKISLHNLLKVFLKMSCHCNVSKIGLSFGGFVCSML